MEDSLESERDENGAGPKVCRSNGQREQVDNMTSSDMTGQKTLKIWSALFQILHIFYLVFFATGTTEDFVTSRVPVKACLSDCRCMWHLTLKL